MFDNIQRLSDDSYRTRVSSMMTSAKALNSDIADLAVQAVLHYIEHSRDISRCRTLYEALSDTGMGRQMTAFTKVLRKCTAQTGIGTDNWKGGKADAELPEGYESVLSGIIENGGAIFMSYADAPKVKSKKEKSGTKSPTVKLPEGTPEPVVNAVQKFLDGKTPEQATIALTAMETGGTEFQNADVQGKFEQLLTLAHELERQEGVVERKVKTDEGEITVKETADDKLLRLFSSSVNFAQTHLSDFRALLDSVKDQAIDEAA